MTAPTFAVILFNVDLDFTLAVYVLFEIWFTSLSVWFGLMGGSRRFGNSYLEVVVVFVDTEIVEVEFKTR